MTNSKKKSYKGLIFLIVILVVGAFAGYLILNRAANSTAGYLSGTASNDTIEIYYTFSGNVASTDTENIMADKILQIETIHVAEGDKIEAEELIFTAVDGTEIKSKIAGTVNKINVEDAQQISPGSVLAEVVDFDNLEISVKVDEYDLDAVAIGNKIDVNIGAIDKDIEGTVREVSRTAISQNGVAYFIATVDLEKDSDIKVGMSAEAKILKEEAKDVVVIPMTALSFDNDNNPFVYVSGERGMNKVLISTGITDGKNVEVTSGLSNGQTVYYKDQTSALTNSQFGPPMMSR